MMIQKKERQQSWDEPHQYQCSSTLLTAIQLVNLSLGFSLLILGAKHTCCVQLTIIPVFTSRFDMQESFSTLSVHVWGGAKNTKTHK